MKHLSHKILYIGFFLLSSAISTYSKDLNNISFRENNGQICDQFYNTRNDIDFQLSLNGLSVFINDGQIHYQWQTPLTSTSSKDLETIRFDRVDVNLIGANRNCEIIKEGRNLSYDIFHTDKRPGGILCNSYNKVIYKNIYPFIDWVIYTKKGAIKYDFVIHPQGDPSDIKIQYNGVESLSIQDDVLIINTPKGTLSEYIPISYEMESGKEVTSKFTLNKNTVSFNIGDYSNTLVIDPVIEWGTYYGGNNADFGHSINNDPFGNVFLTGKTLSTNNIATKGSYQDTASYSYDAFLIKFNSSGDRLWGTYLGGNKFEEANSVLCDSFGNIYVVGHCQNTNTIATQNAHQNTYGGGSYDAFLAKFNTHGHKLWGTFLGGNAREYYIHATLDTNSNIYIAGSTSSTNNIATLGSFKPTTPDTTITQSFIVKFDSSGSRSWGTYFGSDTYTKIVGIACDNNNDIIIAGEAHGQVGITTPGTYKPSKLRGQIDGFIAKFNTSGSRIWGTYFGGSQHEITDNMTIDHNNNIFVTGITFSTDSFGTPGTFKPKSNSIVPAFIIKINSMGNKEWSTFYGNDTLTSSARVHGAISDEFNNIFLVGGTYDTSNIATQNGLKTSKCVNSQEGFIIQFTPSGQRKYGTYFCGNRTTIINDISIFNRNIYIAGITLSTIDIATAKGFQTTINGDLEAFLVKFAPDTTMHISSTSKKALCPYDTFSVNIFTNDTFNTNNSFTVQLSDTSGLFMQPVNIGSKTSTGNSSISCSLPNNITPSSNYKIRAVSSNPHYISNHYDTNISINYMTSNVVISANPGAAVISGTNVTFSSSLTNLTSPVHYQWKINSINTPNGNNSTYSSNTLSNNDTISLTVVDSDSCTKPDTVISNVIVMNIFNSVNDNPYTEETTTIYPNPNSTNSLYITHPNKPTLIEVYTNDGRKISTKTEQIGQTKSKILFNQSIPNGNYYLKIITENRVVVRPLILFRQ